MAWRVIENIDPQATLGGGDDKKDILARRHGDLWVAAVCFPPQPQRFSAVRRKFTGDFEGVARHRAQGFAFFVNQQLTLGQRSELLGLADAPSELYHLERIRNILYSPKGYGIRLEYLRREMSLEEQVTFFNSLQQDLTSHLLELQRAPAEEIAETIERTSATLERTMATAARLASGPSSVFVPTAVLSDVVGAVSTPTATLTVSTLALLHRVVLERDSPMTTPGGQLRSVQVWIGSEETSTYAPPPPEEVPGRLVALLDCGTAFTRPLWERTTQQYSLLSLDYTMGFSQFIRSWTAMGGWQG